MSSKGMPIKEHIVIDPRYNKNVQGIHLSVKGQERNLSNKMVQEKKYSYKRDDNVNSL